MKRIRLLIAFALIGLTIKGQTEMGFHSGRPAQNWEEYLVSGNGIMGLMVAGNPYHEAMVVNHTNLFMPIHEPLIPPSQGNNLNRIRQLMGDGQYKEASQLLIDISHADGYGGKRQSDLFVPAFQVNITSDSMATNHYQRGVNFLSGEIMVEWTDKQGLASFIRVAHRQCRHHRTEGSAHCRQVQERKAEPDD